MSDKNTESRKKNIAAMMKAKSLAIVGISGPGRFGGQVYANLELLGYKGKIYGVNPRYETLYDQKIYPRLSDLPETPDCAILALPNSRLLPVLEEASGLSIPCFDLDPSIGVWLRERRMTLKTLVEFA